MLISIITTYIIGHPVGMYMLASYTCITVVLSAMLYVVAFSKLSIKPRSAKLIKFAAPSAFSVYILNSNWLIYMYFMQERFVYLAEFPAYRIFTDVIGFSLLFVLAVIIVDQLRIKLFTWSKINELTSKIDYKLNCGIQKIADHFKL